MDLGEGVRMDGACFRRMRPIKTAYHHIESAVYNFVWTVILIKIPYLLDLQRQSWTVSYLERRRPCLMIWRLAQ